MLDFFLAPENLPFAVALLVMLLIGAVEAVGLGAGAAHLDLGVDADGGDLLGWLGFGEVPLLIMIVVFLALFGMIGITIQQVAVSIADAPLGPWSASGLAGVAALPLLGVSARGLGRILPRDETTAVSLDSLIAKRATVTIGTARRGSPAQARVRDVHGQVHYVMLEPSSDEQIIREGETALLVRREGNIFIGLIDGDAASLRLDERPQFTR